MLKRACIDGIRLTYNKRKNLLNYLLALFNINSHGHFSYILLLFSMESDSVGTKNFKV